MKKNWNNKSYYALNIYEIVPNIIEGKSLAFK